MVSKLQLMSQLFFINFAIIFAVLNKYEIEAHERSELLIIIIFQNVMLQDSECDFFMNVTIII